MPEFRSDHPLIMTRVYADLDMDCLRPSDELFAKFNVSTTASAGTTPVSQSKAERRSDAESKQKAFVGRMGTETGFEHSIPNAWMASPPGHPFFKLMLQWAEEKVMSGEKLDNRPEAVTGPIALRSGIEKFNKHEYQNSGSVKTYNEILADPTPFEHEHIEAAMEVLPFHYIYPYSWARDGDMFREFCWATRDSFDAQRCKDLVAVDHWPSYTITYWSHTWEREGANEANLRKISEERDV
jgi:hypothetical protein